MYFKTSLYESNKIRIYYTTDNIFQNHIFIKKESFKNFTPGVFYLSSDNIEMKPIRNQTWSTTESNVTRLKFRIRRPPSQFTTFYTIKESE